MTVRGGSRPRAKLLQAVGFAAMVAAATPVICV